MTCPCEINSELTLLRSIAFRLCELDWCVGYALSESQHVELDAIRDAAQRWLNSQMPTGTFPGEIQQ